MLWVVHPNRDAGIAGSELCITSDEAFHLKELPESIVIAGGGYIAVEFACIFAGLGSNVTLVYRGEQILRGFDDDLRQILYAEMIDRGIDIRLGQVFKEIAGAPDSPKQVTLTDGSKIDASENHAGNWPETLQQKGLGLIKPVSRRMKRVL